MPRPRIHATSADRYKAYRDRKKEREAVGHSYFYPGCLGTAFREGLYRLVATSEYPYASARLRELGALANQMLSVMERTEESPCGT